MNVTTTLSLSQESLSAQHGVSDDAQVIRERFRAIVDDLGKLMSIGREYRAAEEDLRLAFHEASVDNWDGYGALRADVRSKQLARRLLQQLPQRRL